MSDVEIVHYLSHDHDVLPVVCSEDNPLWVLVGLLIAGALLLILGALALCYLAGVWLAGRVGRWAEARR